MMEKLSASVPVEHLFHSTLHTIITSENLDKSLESFPADASLNPFRLRVPVEVPAKNWVKIEISSNCFNIGAKPISSTLITNMDKDFENIVAKVPKMAQKVAQMS